ncbi:phage baseplate assembly protein V [Enterobacteriaceae bacterium ML5]|nr:phage baseplate assembly protein V [Enterobacteriaceae bacterium ML5]
MPTNAELYRLLCNLIRIGTITEVDPVKYLARVACGENETDWIRWRAERAGDSVTWFPPSVGEQVIIICPNGEMTTAAIMGSLYSDSAPPPSQAAKNITFSLPDGAIFSYDAESSVLSVSGVKTLNIECETGTVTAAESFTFDAPNVICTQQLTAATLQVSEGGGMKGDISHSGGTFTSNGVAVDKHSHGGVQSGGSWTEGTK